MTVEQQARVDLAAAHRLAALEGWTDLNYNHFTVRVGGDRFLIKRHSLFFDEVTASNLIEVDSHGEPVGDARSLAADELNRAGFVIHSAVYRARPDVHAVMHVHSQVGTALSVRKGGLRCLAQEAMKFYNRVSYHDFEGIALDAAECDRIGRDLGRNNTMILRNHGLLTCGATVADAVLSLRALIMAAEVQLQVEACGFEVNEPAPEICERTARQFEAMDAAGGYSVEWAGVLRWLDRSDASYRR